MKSFLDRTFLVGNFVAEHGYGSVKYKTTEGEEKKARFLFLTGGRPRSPADEPSGDARKEEKRRLDEAKKNKTAPPAPAFSARGKLVEVALEPGEREFFARSIVNRLWHRFFGQGLVMPLDQMHSENPPSHPELLQWLARDVVEHGYDLRRLIRGLVLSHAYARESRGRVGEPRPSPLRRRLAPGLDPDAAGRLDVGRHRRPGELPRRRRPREGRAAGRTWPGARLDHRQARRGLPDRRRRGALHEQLATSSTTSSPTAATASSAGSPRSPTAASRSSSPSGTSSRGRPTTRKSRILGDFLAQREDRPVEAAGSSSGRS